MAENKKNFSSTRGGGNGQGFSKPDINTADYNQTARKAAKKRKQRGHGSNPYSKKEPQTAPTLLKEFNPETFKVRNKAAALLQAPYTEQMIAAFGKSIHMPADELFDLIWALTYRPESDTIQLLKKLDLSPKMVSDLPMLLNELAAQYRNYVDPSFMLEPDINTPATKQAFDSLYGENHAAALFIYERCQAYFSYKNASEISKVSYLLSQKDPENVYCGGIQALLQERDYTIRRNQTEFLKQWREKIEDLFKAMADVKAAEEKANATTPNPGPDLAGTPALEKKAAPVAPASQQEPKDAKVLVTTLGAVDNSPKDFNYANVAANPELFGSMVNATAQLKELGIDPALILKNLDQVREFLLLATQLEDAGFSTCQYPGKENAIIKVLKAEEARKEAEAQLNT